MIFKLLPIDSMIDNFRQTFFFIGEQKINIKPEFKNKIHE